jgi:hypothetical protein
MNALLRLLTFLACLLGTSLVSGAPVLAQPCPTGAAACSQTAYLVPTDIDSTGATDAAARLASFIASVPDRSTIVFPAGATYRLDRALKLTHRSDLSFDGNGSTLKVNDGCDPGDSAFFIELSTSIAIDDFTIVGQWARAGTPEALSTHCQNQEAIAMYGATNVDIANLRISRVSGDGVYIGPSGTTWSNAITIRDTSITAVGRNGVAITAASDVRMERNNFDAIALHVLDIEPDSAAGGATNVLFAENTIGSYGLTRLFVSYLLAANGADGSTVHDVTVRDNQLFGSPLSVSIQTPGRRDIRITGNVSEDTSGRPVLLFTEVEGLDYSGNVRISRSPDPSGGSPAPGADVIGPAAIGVVVIAVGVVALGMAAALAQARRRSRR